MNPYIIFALGGLLSILLMVAGWKFISRNRNTDKTDAGEKENADRARQATETLASTLESERKETARGIEADRKNRDEMERRDRKETAAIIEEGHKELVREVHGLSTAMAVLTERVSALIAKVFKRDGE